LTNPAGAHVQVVGVFSSNVVEKVASALAALGTTHAFVVHGEDGLDEISISGETQVGEVRLGEVRLYTVTPEDFDLPRAPLSAIAGSDAKHNAALIRAIFAGGSGPWRDIVIANAAAALVAAGRASGFREGARIAANSIDSKAAWQKLEALVAFTSKR
jgi:anthranilate phosphoribosyltransferase